MTRIMYDAIYADQAPGGGALYAGYVGGSWPSYAAMVAAHPAALHISIAVNATERARALDVEQGDATPAQAPGWAEDERRTGNPWPVIYCNASTWPVVRAEFAAQHVAEPLYWIADYVDDPSQPPTVIPAGAIAVQWYDFGAYDQSLVADYWPGLDPAPKPPAPPARSLEEDEMPESIKPLSVYPGGEYAYDVPDGKTQLRLTADGNTGNPALLRIAFWNGDGVSVIGDDPVKSPPVQVGGRAHHTVGHTLPTGCTGVSVTRKDKGSFSVAVGFHGA